MRLFVRLFGRNPLLLFATLVAIAPPGRAIGADADPAPVRVLLMTGQNNHKWRATTPAMTEVIEAAGRFDLTVSLAPWEFGADAFDDCDVVLSNWSVWPKTELDPWKPETKTAFLEYMNSGGGLVVVHAGSSVHYPWPAFQAMVGRTWKRGKTWHGKSHEFTVAMAADHPITRGVGEFRIFEELWRDMAPTGDCEVLATADTSGDRKPGPQEPMLLTTRHGEGRGVNLVLGHGARAYKHAHFQELFLRSLEWAATGEVAAPFVLKPEASAE
ncbi:MAG: ThuA domain-containing protein [Planctomycetota bacterium]